MKLSNHKIAHRIKGRLSRKDYWERRKELRAQYQRQLRELKQSVYA